MSAPAASFYVTGGTLHHDAPSYVERQADANLLAALQRGEFCYVLTARQMGKSSLMAHTAVRLRKERVAVAVLDFTALGQNLSPEQWYGGLLDHLGRQLDLDDALEAFWLEHEHMGPLQRWMRALREVVLAQCPGRVVLFIDEIDAVRSLPFSTDEFFAAIRECYNRRSQVAEFVRLTFCLLGVATPSDLIRDTRITPFNIGKHIELTDFTPAEAAPLARGLGGPGQRLLQRVLFWTGGHPYLTQRLCQAVAELTTAAPNPPSAIRHPKSVDRLCEALLLSKSAQESDDNLLFVRERLLRSEAEPAALLDLYRQVRAGKRVALDDTNRLVNLLQLSGITRVVNGCLRVRNRVYERVFDRAWITAHMPDAELRRQQAAFRRGLLRATIAFGVVLAVVSGLAFSAISQARTARRATTRATLQRFRAEERERTARRYLYAAQMREAQQRWEEGNLRRARELLDAARPRVGEEDLRGFEWRYLWKLCQGDALFTLRGHGEVVMAVAFSPDGRVLASGSSSGKVYLWDVARRQVIATLRGHPAWVSSVAFSPDGQLLASGGLDNKVRVWEVRSRRLVATLPEFGYWRHCLAFSPDGAMLAWSGTRWATVHLCDVGGFSRRRGPWRPRPIATLSGEPGAVWQVAFSPDGKLLAVGSGEGTVRLWAIAARRKPGGQPRPIVTYRKHATGINSLAFSPDSRLLATGSSDNTLGLWDVQARRLTARLVGHSGEVDGVAFSPDGKTLASGSFDQTLRLWDVASRQALATLRGHDGKVFGVAFSSHGRLLASGSDDRTIKLWDPRSRPDEVITIQQNSPAHMVKFSPDSQVMAMGCADRTVKLWDVAARRHLATLSGHKGFVDALAYHPNGKLLLSGSVWESEKPSYATTDWDSAKLWDVDRVRHGRRPRLVAAFPGFRGWGWGLAISPNGRWMAMYTKEAVQLRELATRRLVASFPRKGNHYFDLLFSPDSKHLAAQGDDGTVTLWDVARKRAALSVPGDAMCRMAFTPDGRTFVAGSGGRNVRLWDLSTGRPIATIKRQLNGGEEISLSPDGKTLALISGDSTVQLWSVAARQEVATLKGHAGPLGGIEFSADGRILATASADGSVRLWPAASFAEAESLHVSASVADRRVLLQWPPATRATGYLVYRGPAGAAQSRLVRLTPRPLSDSSFDDRSASPLNGRAQRYGVAPVYPRRGSGTEEGPMTVIHVTPLALPPGLLGCSLNEGPQQGAVAIDAATNEMSVRGSGEGIYGEADGCYYLYQPLVGDFQITVRSLAPPTHTNELAKAGLVVRETLDTGSRHASLVRTAGHGLHYLRRSNGADATDYVTAPGTWAPRRSRPREIRLRLTRRGSIVTAEYAMDGGRSWRQVGHTYPDDPPLPRTLYVGLAVTSHNPSEICEAKFRDLRFLK